MMALRNELVQYVQRSRVLPDNRIWATPPNRPAEVNADGTINNENYPWAQVSVQDVQIIYDSPAGTAEPQGDITWSLTVQGRTQEITEDTAEAFMFRINRRGMFRTSGGLKIRNADVTGYTPASGDIADNIAGWIAEVTFSSSVAFNI